MEKLVLIGKILTTHGLNGNVKLESFCENPIDIFNYELFDDKCNKMICRQVGRTSNPSIFLAKFENINSIDEAREYRNFEIYTKRKNLENLSDNQFYVDDIIGLKVVGENKNGIVDNFYNYGGGDTLEIKWSDGKMESIPFSYVKEIKNDTVYVELPTYI